VREYEAALEILGQSATTLVIAQHSIRQPLAASYGRLRNQRQVRQGDNMLSFYEGAVT
jgi:hypothetical protein